jgi:HK97 family phage portal protein
MYEKNVVVRAAVDTIINEICAAKWLIRPIDEDEKLSPEKLADQKQRIKKIENFFRHPNENRESFRFFQEKVLWDLLVYDAGSIEKVRSNSGQLKEIYAIPGDTIRIKADNHAKILGYWQVLETSSSKKQDPEFFEAEDILYIMMNPRSSSLYGFSPLNTLENMITAFLYGESYNIKYFENNATPRGILEIGNISEPQLDRFREYWRQENLQQPHRIMVLSNPNALEGKGGAKWIPLATNAKDMELMQYLNWVMKMILMVYGVTPSEVGFADEVKGAPLTGQVLQSQAFRNKAIYPMMDRLSSYYTEEIIVSEFDSPDLQFDFEEEQSIQEQLQKAQLDMILIQANIKTPEEARKERGLEIKKKPTSQLFDQRPSQDGEQNNDLDSILQGLKGENPDEVDVIINENESKEKNIVDLAFDQLKDALCDSLNIDEQELISNKDVSSAIEKEYNNLRSAINNYMSQGKSKDVSKLIENAYKNLSNKVNMYIIQKQINSAL